MRSLSSGVATVVAWLDSVRASSWSEVWLALAWAGLNFEDVALARGESTWSSRKTGYELKYVAEKGNEGSHRREPSGKRASSAKQV